ncbi:MAG: LuxR C-terminal-related transcriptional regulator, partial [Ilumatobacteraceae bacterium]
ALWWSMIESLRAVAGDFGDAYRNRLLGGGSGTVDEVVVSVGDELAGRGTPIHLFLDDVHVIDDEICRRSLHRFVSSLPGGARVTVASRRSAPIPLGRLRANGDLVEIGPSDLMLSAREARELLTSFDVSFDVSFDRARVDVLVARTEGWPAGLQLAGLAASEAADVGSFVEGFSGTDRDIADYLIGEVLESVSAEDRDFMVETSVLSRLTGGLCDAVTGRPGGADTLARLEESNAFVIALDRDDRWFRYHHLFGDLLAAELQRSRPDEVRLLHRRAFEWLRDDGQIADAIPHGLAADETGAAADLLCAHWASMMGSGRHETARALIALFPPEFGTGHQPLAIAGAAVKAMTGHSEAARYWLDAAARATHDGPRPEGMASTESSLALTRGTLALDGVDAALADGRTALTLEPPGSPGRDLAALLVARSLVMRGDVDEAAEYLEEAEHSDLTNTRTYALAELSLGHLGRGDAERALTIANTARDQLREAGGDDLIVAAIAHAAAALAAIDLEDERTARVALRAAHRPIAAVGQPLPMDSLHARLLLARAALALGEVDTAREYLGGAKQFIDSIDDVGVMREQHAELTARLGELHPDADGDTDDQMTERELEVLAMLPTPLTTREIAEELFISRNTVKTHLRRVYRKLHALSREEAVLAARTSGLLPASDDQQPAD